MSTSGHCAFTVPLPGTSFLWISAGLPPSLPAGSCSSGISSAMPPDHPALTSLRFISCHHAFLKLLPSLGLSQQKNFLIESFPRNWHNIVKAFMCCAKSLQSCPTLYDLMDCIPPGSSRMEFSRQEYCNGLPFIPLGDLPNPGFKPSFPVSPALEGRFFTTEPENPLQMD